MQVREFTCLKINPCGSFYLTNSVRFLPAGCQGLRFYLSSGKPIGQLSPMGFLPADCHGTKLYRALFLYVDVYRVSMHVTGFTCPKRSPCGSFYLTNSVRFWPAGCQLPWFEFLPVQREAHGSAVRNVPVWPPEAAPGPGGHGQPLPISGQRPAKKRHTVL